MTDLNRRRFMAGTLVAAGGGLMTGFGARRAQAADAAPAEASRRALRFVHFGDTHVGAPGTLPLSTGPEGYQKALAAAQGLDDPGEFILHTGDIITDAFWATEASAREQWARYRQVMADHCKLPVRYTLGNHDVNFGWGRTADGEPYPGKALPMEELGLERPYYSFDHGGWHFVVLDNTQPGGWNGFQIMLDETQFAWFADDLAKTDPNTPVLVASHAPILTVTCFFEPRVKQHPDGMVMTDDGVHQDVVRIHDLFRKHRNVKLCLSGHYHQVDHVQYLGVHHVCGGAVCADYWRRPLPYRPEFEAGFGIVDLFTDGSFEYRYHDYGLVGNQDDANRPRYPWGRVV